MKRSRVLSDLDRGEFPNLEKDTNKSSEKTEGKQFIF